MSFDEESKALYDVVAPPFDESQIQDLRRQLNALLPGEGDLYGRLNAFRARFSISSSKLQEALAAAITESRRQVREHMGLPTEESIETAFVYGRPWGAALTYQGQGRSLVEINTSAPFGVAEVMTVAGHEMYPGHHTHLTLLDKSLVQDRGWVEFTILPLNSPLALIAEGLAEYGSRDLLAGPERIAFQQTVLFPMLNLEASEAQRYQQIMERKGRLDVVLVESARRYLDGRMTRNEMRLWLRENYLVMPGGEENLIRFIEQQRSYVVNYTVGRQLLRDYIESRAAGDSAKRWQWFHTLASTPQTPSALARADGESSDALSDAVDWLEAEAHRIVRASKRTMADGTAAFPPQVGLGYEAFWLRDYEYTLEGAVDAYSNEELTDACRLFVRHLADDGAAVDCIKFDGTPIYKPGFGSMGLNPVADGSQFTVAVAWHTWRRTQDDGLLREIIDPLVRTMNAAPRNPETGLVHIEPGEKRDRCPYGFTDTIRKQGDVLFCSLLYVQACRQLSDLLDAAQRPAEARRWQTEGQRVAQSIRRIFWDERVGLFRAATVCCREPDLWGSAFAVYLGVADANQSRAIATYFQQHYAHVVQRGQIRHLPGGLHWERADCAPDTYQNGAYWATPTGWFVYALDLVDPDLADQTILDLVADFKEGGACEWIFGERRQLPQYLASAANPLAGIRAMLQRRNSQR